VPALAVKAQASRAAARASGAKRFIGIPRSGRWPDANG